MYGAKEKVVWFAVTSRASIIALQFIFNRILPDHDAGVFVSPLARVEEASIYDDAVDYLFGGLCRWDAQYFLHVARYGYTYENTLAFPPLYPMAVRYLSIIFSTIFFALNQRSTTILAALLINFLCFVKSAAIFYELSRTVLKDSRLAYRAAVLYCVNPASIFFSAFYTESMFACLSFHVMLAYSVNNPYIYLPIGLSTLVRSNGLINIGFPVYSWVKSSLEYLLPRVSKKYENHRGESPPPYRCTTMLRSFVWLMNIVFLSLTPYVLLQLYNYSLFCLDKEMDMPDLVLNYGLKNGLLITGTENPPWCESSVPISYSYVQKKYWDVGFLSYYTFKQIPNFVLAFPILYVMLSRSLEYLNEHRVELFTLGSFSSLATTREKFAAKKYPSDMFVFVIHGLFLTIFCIFFVHIQVSTRLLCSASPLLYWYCALEMSRESCEKEKENSSDFEHPENLSSKWRVYLLSQKKYSKYDIAILLYFLGYLLTGCLMFPNFLPWT